MQNEFGLHKESKHPYFEGWYIKGMQEDIIFSIIIGIQYQSSQTLAFIQFMISKTYKKVFRLRFMSVF